MISNLKGFIRTALAVCQLRIRQTTQNSILIHFSMGPIEECINMFTDVSENMMECFLKNVKYIVDCFLVKQQKEASELKGIYCLSF